MTEEEEECLTTEEEWLTCEDPQAMLDFLRVASHGEHPTVEANWPPHFRKARLFICACAREVWLFLTDERSKQAIEKGERYADQLITEDEAIRVWHAAFAAAKAIRKDPFKNAAFAANSAATTDAVWSAIYSVGQNASAALAKAAAKPPKRAPHLANALAKQIALLRDIFGNPFRPVSFDPTWLTSTVTALARQMYESRDFSAMPILADALQDAGCDNAQVLEHCRGPGPHVRGCWVVDGCLNKS
jgi:hypothetical protein